MISFHFGLVLGLFLVGTWLLCHMSHKIKGLACQARLKASETKRISGRDMEEVMRQSWQLRSRVLRALGSVSQKSRNFSGLFRVSQFSLYFRNVEVLSHQTSQSSSFFLHWRYVHRSAFQNKQIAVWQRVFRTRKVLGTFEKHARWLEIWWHRRSSLALTTSWICST